LRLVAKLRKNERQAMLLPQVAKQAKSEIFSLAGVAGFVWSQDHQTTQPSRLGMTCAA